MATYKTKEEADDAAYEENGKPIICFCPLINSQCREDCECFQRAMVRECKIYKRDLSVGGLPYILEYKVTYRGCGNAMFSGERNCNT